MRPRATDSIPRVQMSKIPENSDIIHTVLVLVGKSRTRRPRSGTGTSTEPPEAGTKNTDSSRTTRERAGRDLSLRKDDHLVVRSGPKRGGRLHLAWEVARSCEVRGVGGMTEQCDAERVHNRTHKERVTSRGTHAKHLVKHQIVLCCACMHQGVHRTGTTA
jgi:hypothetical protein